MNDRLNATLAYIRSSEPLCAYESRHQSSSFERGQQSAINKHYARMIEDRILTLGLSRKDLDGALSLSESFKNSDERQEQRQVMRATMLAEFTVRGRPLSEAPELRKRYLAMKDTEALRRAFRSMFPSILSVQGRTAWMPTNFTNPNTLPPFHAFDKLKPPVLITRDGRKAQYRFSITSLPNDERAVPTLEDFDKTIYKWSAVSTSVIAHDNAVIYGNAGLILQCHPMGILTASGGDQNFENHTGTTTNTRAAPHTGHKPLDDGRLAEEVHRKFFETNHLFDSQPMRLMSPEQVLAHTNLEEAKKKKITGWNEVVQAGPLLKVKGLFLRIKPDGSPLTKMNGDLALPEGVYKAMRACSRRLGLPIVGLVDSRDAG